VAQAPRHFYEGPALPPAHAARRYTLSYMGKCAPPAASWARQHGCRSLVRPRLNASLHGQRGNDSFRVSFVCSDELGTPDSAHGGRIKYSASVRERYRRSMNSTFVLVPRGDNRWNYRFSEAVGACAIPVVLADGLSLPLEPLVDWSGAAVVVPEAAADDAATLLRWLPPRQRWDEMLAAVCRINANHFATRQLRDRSIVDAALLLLRNGSSPAPATETPGGGGGAPGEAADRQGGGICVAVAATADRVGALHRLATSWPGLLSVAFLSHNFTRDAALGLRALAAPGGSLPASPGRIALSLVPNRPSGARPYVRRGRGGLFGDLFPTNLLRNVALDACGAADVALVLDVDFSFCCGDVARTLDRYARAVRADTGLSYVLPAFEAAEGEVIRSKGELLDRLDRSGAGVFEKQAQASHACDRLEQWRGATEPFASPYTYMCEPYLLVHRSVLPPYDESFVGYGKNRLSLHYELAARRVRMEVAPDAFVLHERGSHASRSKAWWAGETCWPAFRKRVWEAHGFWRSSRRQRQLDANPRVLQALNRTCGACVARSARLCVGSCRPELARWLPGSRKPTLLPPSGAPLEAPECPGGTAIASSSEPARLRKES